MLSSVLATITCVAIPVTDPLQIPAQTTPGAAVVEVGTYVTPTSFRSRNFSGVDHLLVFAPADHSVAPVVVVLPPNGVVQYEFAPSALEGLVYEVVSVRDGQLTSSGANPLALPVTQGDMCLWTMSGESYLVTWQQFGCEVTRLPLQGSLLPNDGNESGTEPMSAPPCAVPVAPRLPPPTSNAQYSPM